MQRREAIGKGLQGVVGRGSVPKGGIDFRGFQDAGEGKK